MFSVRVWLVGVLVVSSVSFFCGWHVNGWRWQADLAHEREAAQRLQDQLDEALEARERERAGRLLAVENAGLLEQQLQRAGSQVVTREVIKYVQSPSSGACELSDDWVRIHNAAAGVSGVPKAADMDDGKAGGARTDRDALPVIAANYERCLRSAGRLSALQDWLMEVGVE